MEIVTILGVLAIAGMLFYFVYFAIPPAQTGTYLLFENSIPGDFQQSFTTLLPPSYNQPEGMVYSYTTWLLMKDFTKGYGKRRRIFSKNDSPGLYIDSTSNSFVVSVETFGTTETILIPNIPAMKWIHLGLVVDQHSVDVYINGILRKHHTLSQLPRLNDAAVTIGSNWDGVIARLTYYARSLTHLEIKKMVNEKVPSDLQRQAAAPGYFDISWYIGRLYSA